MTALRLVSVQVVKGRPTVAPTSREKRARYGAPGFVVGRSQDALLHRGINVHLCDVLHSLAVVFLACLLMQLFNLQVLKPHRHGSACVYLKADQPSCVAVVIDNIIGNHSV
jgi:hypothetical protein